MNCILYIQMQYLDLVVLITIICYFFFFNLCVFNSIGSYKVLTIMLRQTLIIPLVDECKTSYVCILISLQAYMEVRTDIRIRRTKEVNEMDQVL